MCDLIGVQIAPEDLEHRSVTLIDAGNRIDDARFGAAWQQVETIVAAYLERLGEIDIWMTPTFSSEIVRIGVFGPDVAWDDQKDHLRSEERRVGQECVSPCRSRGSPEH